jgi:hypothetical protein
MSILKFITLLFGLVAISGCKSNKKISLVDYIEVNTGFVIKCSEAEIRIQQPVEFLKIGSVKIPKAGFQPADSRSNETKGALLPYFHMYADRVHGPKIDGTYQVWTGSSESLSWCFAYDTEEEILWFALDYED